MGTRRTKEEMRRDNRIKVKLLLKYNILEMNNRDCRIQHLLSDEEYEEAVNIVERMKKDSYDEWLSIKAVAETLNEKIKARIETKKPRTPLCDKWMELFEKACKLLSWIREEPFNTDFWGELAQTVCDLANGCSVVKEELDFASGKKRRRY